MAGFPLDLGDREVRLPSDIYRSEVASRPPSHHYSCMDDISERLAGFTLLQPRQNVCKHSLSPSPNSEHFGPAVRYGTGCRAPQEYMVLNGGLEENGHRIYGPSLSGNKMLYESQLLEAAQRQILLERLRARVLLAQQNRLQNQFRPFQGSGGSGVGGGVVKESGGTGVFIPRTFNTTTRTRSAGAATATTTTTTTTTTDIRKNRVLRNGRENQVTQQGSCLGEIGVGMRRESHHYLPPEMGLPQDWTY